MRSELDQMRLLICSSCAGARDYGAEVKAVESALTRAGLGAQVAVDQHACFSGCSEPVAIALQADGGASYVFSGVDVASDADDIVATCRTYLESPKGWIEDARPCGRLRMCLRARIPAL
ncbi:MULTISPECIES: DUF1636 domain-containing protein [unclassified Ruegeria]|uniref:DUF1636 domain-containing protein n=1 Tax=unclassified Ruegeria TaxID=2625375 RepID=UPI001FFE0870|nr:MULTISPECIES: DUF1636 domain-containing protein [unclassified Ruegeria]